MDDKGAPPLHFPSLTARIAAAKQGCPVGQRDLFTECLKALELIEALCAAADGLLFCAAMNALRPVHQDVPEPWKQHLDTLSAARGRVRR